MWVIQAFRTKAFPLGIATLRVSLGGSFAERLHVLNMLSDVSYYHLICEDRILMYKTSNSTQPGQTCLSRIWRIEMMQIGRAG